jgi:Flp pilus assembly protein TadG
MKIQHSKRRHGGATIAESALVLSMFLLFLFGIFEYGRFIFLTQVATNAARAGARYASINIDKPSTFVATDVDASTPSITKYVRNQMGGADTMMGSFAVTAFPCDATKLYLDPPVVAAKTTYTSWNDASFPDRIGVKITGNYQPILPSFIFYMTTGSVIPLNITACSSSEG